jgi:hypothetical protein
MGALLRPGNALSSLLANQKENEIITYNYAEVNDDKMFYREAGEGQKI